MDNTYDLFMARLAPILVGMVLTMIFIWYVNHDNDEGTPS